MADGRRRQWVAVETDLLAQPFMERLCESFGWAAVTLWVALLMAAKRGFVEGRLRWITEADALAQMGLDCSALRDDTGESFSLEDFLKVTGAFKKTTSRRTGRGWETTLTGWGDVQQARGRRSTEPEETDGTASEDSSDNHGSRTNGQARPPNCRNDPASDSDLDRDKDKDPSLNSFQSSSATRTDTETDEREISNRDPKPIAATVASILRGKP